MYDSIAEVVKVYQLSEFFVNFICFFREEDYFCSNEEESGAENRAVRFV